MTNLIGRYAISQRRACRVVQATRSLVYYRSRKDPLTALRQRMRELGPDAGEIPLSPAPRLLRQAPSHALEVGGDCRHLQPNMIPPTE